MSISDNQFLRNDEAPRMKIKARLAKFIALSRPERRTLLAAIVLLPLVWLGLQCFGLRRLQLWLQRPTPTTGASLSTDEIARIAALVNSAASLAPIPATCLTRSLLLGWMLRRRGVASQLRIGVRMNQGKLDAHAWVEYEGVPINDQPDVGKQFAAFDEILPPGTSQSA